MARDVRPIWKRFELDYHRRRAPFRRWKLYASCGLAVLAASWVVLAAVLSERHLYSSGPMSAAHVLLSDDCVQCHTQTFSRFAALSNEGKARTMNMACLKCHAHTIGHNETDGTAWHQFVESGSNAKERTLACGMCHVEHKGSLRLTDMDDGMCVQCHADLRQSAGVQQPSVAGQIIGLNVPGPAGRHPDFGAHAARDPAEISFNHEVHLKALTQRREGVTQTTQLECADCHRAGRSGRPWRFGRADLHADSGAADTPSEPELQAAYMQPIRYSLHCMDCHALVADERLAGTPTVAAGTVPHDTPGAIRNYLLGQMTAYLQSLDAEEQAITLSRSGNSRGGLRPRLLPLPPAREMNRLVLEWVQIQVLDIERLIYQDMRVCQKCHTMKTAATEGDGLPAIMIPAIPSRWLRHASFNHEKHRVLNCLACHDKVTGSSATQDVLLPHIEACCICHAPRQGAGDRRTGGVSDRCVLCHTFHRPPPPVEPDPGAGAPPTSGMSISDVVAGPAGRRN